MQDHFKTHGAFGWNELMTTDPSAARKFYQALFGWELEDYDMGNMQYTVEKAAKLDARVLATPRDIPDVGRMAILQDPQGAVFMVITYLEMEG